MEAFSITSPGCLAMAGAFSQARNQHAASVLAELTNHGWRCPIPIWSALSKLFQGIIGARGGPRDYLRNAIRAAARIPETMTAQEAANAFARWLYREPPEPGDDPIITAANSAEQQ
jgi:hypothetical protein